MDFSSGLDVAAITKTVVETIRKKGFVCVCLLLYVIIALLFLGRCTKPRKIRAWI